MIKIEYLAQRHLKQKPSFRTRLLATFPNWLDRVSAFRHLPALHNRFSVFAWFSEKLLGITRHRHLPEPVSEPFQYHRYRSELAAPTDKEVVLFVDSFTRNFHPQNAVAALELLECAGYRVYVAQPEQQQETLCCGRTQLAHGLLEEAKHNARRLLEVLVPHAEAGRTIIGLEPACLLAVRDDYRFLGLGASAEKVAKLAILFEEFVAKERMANRFQLEFHPIRKKVLVHGHCHQKAVGAMKSMRKLLKLIPNVDFEMVESSCCGMAGSFGIEKENADMAMQMAELSLLPALRAQPEALVVANGFSCQHQIREGCEHEPVHVAVLLRDAIIDDTKTVY